MALTKEQFLAAKDRLKRSTIQVPELGDVVVRELTTSQRGRLELMLSKDYGGKVEELQNIISLVCVYGIMNGAGPMFTEKDLETVGEMPSSITQPIYDEVLKISKLDEVAKEAAKKNSKASR